MEIDNDRRASIAKMILISTPFVLLLVSGLLALFLVILTWIPVVISAALMIVGWGVTVILRLKSVKFRFSNDTISVLYYPISPMTSNFRKIEINTKQLTDYRIIKSFFGLRKELVLYENIGGEKAAYPPVSISLFKKSAQLEIEEILKRICA